jgi:hypothetical protein
MKRILKFIFPLILEIKSKSGVLHFRRYRILNLGKFGAVYLHYIYQADKDLHLHNHPWNYIQIPLKGKYLEEVENDVINLVKPFQINKRNGLKYHKIKVLLNPKIITLFFVGKRYNEDWGYLVDGKNIPQNEYRKLKQENKL